MCSVLFHRCIFIVRARGSSFDKVTFFMLAHFFFHFSLLKLRGMNDNEKCTFAAFDALSMLRSCVDQFFDCSDDGLVPTTVFSKHGALGRCSGNANTLELAVLVSRSGSF